MLIARGPFAGARIGPRHGLNAHQAEQVAALFHTTAVSGGEMDVA
jgi:hypothetical protein